MRLSDYIKDIRKKGRHYFTVNEAAGVLQVSKNAAMIAAHRLRAKGDLISPAKGFYVIVPPEDQPYGCVPARELVPILMRHLQIDYYVALLSADEFYGAAHQKVARFQIITNKRIKHPLDFGDVCIQVIYKKSLAGLPMKDFTVKTGYLKVATPELTAIDLFKYPARAAGISHIATVLSELIESMDAEKLGELHQIQRIGYVAERVDVMDDEQKNSFIVRLEDYLKQNKRPYIPLAPLYAKNWTFKVQEVGNH